MKGSSCGYRRCVAIILLGSLAALFHFCSTENVLAAAGTSANLPVQQNSLPQSAHENLMSIKGIGPVSASVLLSAIGNIRDSDPDKLAAYFGLVPRIQKSNETEHSGRITKQVNKLARTLWCSARSSPNALQLIPAELLSRIQRRRGRGKANIALARKFVEVTYHTLKNDCVSEDFPNFVLAS